MVKKAQTFKLDPELLENLKKEAPYFQRSFNNYVEKILFDRTSKFTKHKK